METRPNHGNGSSVFLGHVLGGQPAGSARANLTQPPPFHAGEQRTGLIVVEHHNHLGATRKRRIGLVSKNTVALVGSDHEMEEPTGHADAVSGTIVHLSGSSVGKGLFQHVDALIHGQ